MERNWERSPHVMLTRQQAQDLIECAFPGEVLDRFQTLSTGLANTNIRFQLRGKAEKFVLRLHTRDHAAALRERELMHYLSGDSSPPIPVAPLIYSDHEPKRGAHPYSIWGFVEGTLLQDLFDTASDSELADVAERCGVTLAAIHSHRFERSGEFGLGLQLVEEYEPPSRFIPEFIRQGLFEGRAGARLGDTLRDTLWERVERFTPSLLVLDNRYSLVHADFKRSNLIMTRDEHGWSVAAVLDWEFACSAPPLVDIGLFLRAGNALPPGFREAFQTGYQRGGGWLPDNWVALARLVDVMSQVTFLNDVRNRPHVFAESISVLKETIETFG